MGTGPKNEEQNTSYGNEIPEICERNNKTKQNVDIREELEIKSMLDYIEERQLNWWGHLQRMEDISLVKNGKQR